MYHCKVYITEKNNHIKEHTLLFFLMLKKNTKHLALTNLPIQNHIKKENTNF